MSQRVRSKLHQYTRLASTGHLGPVVGDVRRWAWSTDDAVGLARDLTVPFDPPWRGWRSTSANSTSRLPHVSSLKRASMIRRRSTWNRAGGSGKTASRARMPSSTRRGPPATCSGPSPANMPGWSRTTSESVSRYSRPTNCFSKEPGLAVSEGKAHHGRGDEPHHRGGRR